MNDNEKIKELVKLSEENPELEIITATYCDVVAEDWGYWVGKIKEIKKDYFWSKDETWTAGSKSDILDSLSDDLSDYPEYKDMDEKIYAEKVSEYFDYLVSEDKIKEAIIIYIELP